MIVKNPIAEIFQTWKADMEPVVGEGNVAMEQSATVEHCPFARLFLMGNIGRGYDLQGNEAATMPSLQVECFADGEFAIEDVYDIDETSHATLTRLGFRRFFGPELVTNIDNDIKRTVSRYRRIYAGTFETNQIQ